MLLGLLILVVGVLLAMLILADAEKTITFKPLPSVGVKSIYLIGSLRNKDIPQIGNHLRGLGFDCFDDWFSPGPQADDYWRDYETLRGNTYKEALKGWAGKHIFAFDKHHLDRCDAAVMVLPSGKSCHLELGYSCGRGKKTAILFLETPERYDVMYQFADEICFSMEELDAVLLRWKNGE